MLGHDGKFLIENGELWKDLYMLWVVREQIHRVVVRIMPVFQFIILSTEFEAKVHISVFLIKVREWLGNTIIQQGCLVGVEQYFFRDVLKVIIFSESLQLVSKLHCLPKNP